MMKQILIVIFLLVTPLAVGAESGIVVDGDCTLFDAIIAANTDAPSGACPAGAGPDHIQLAVDVTLSEGDDTLHTALPDITSAMTIDGAGHTVRVVWSVEETGLSESPYIVFRTSSEADLTLRNITVSGGNSGLFNQGGQVTVIDSVFIDNEMGLRNFDGALTVLNSRVVFNDGGALMNVRGHLIVENSVLSNNKINWHVHQIGFTNGSAVEVRGGTALITNCVMVGNDAESGGGVKLTNGGTVTVVDSIIANNHVNIAGGGLYVNNGTLTVINSTITDNTINLQNGGVFIDQRGSVTLLNTTVTGHAGGDCRAATAAGVFDGMHNIDSDGTCPG